MKFFGFDATHMSEKSLEIFTAQNLKCILGVTNPELTVIFSGDISEISSTAFDDWIRGKFQLYPG